MQIIGDFRAQERELDYKYFLDYQNYAEIKLLHKQDSDNFCYRCNKPLDPLTWLDPDFYYLPCWDCVGKRKSDRVLTTEAIIRNIKEFYNTRILGDRYFQLFIVDNIYFSNTLPHEYSVFKKIINSLSPPSRNDIWFLDWIVGYPKVISLENLQGLKIVNLSSIYKNIVLDKDLIQVGDYEIHFPEVVSFDLKHHSRYSILNKRGDRKSKRIKLGDHCIKFFNTDNDNIKAIFKLTKNGNEVAIRSLSYQDYAVIKLAIMRNKTFLKLVFDILTEITRFVKVYRDSVFLKNTITIDPKKEVSVNFIWNSVFFKEYDNENFVNISLI